MSGPPGPNGLAGELNETWASAADGAGDDSDLDNLGVVKPGMARVRVKKAPSAFRTISEVADDLHIPQHVLRFWETKFSQVRPLKRGGGRRYYRPHDITLLRRISDLLYVQGFTIKGVQRLLREGGGRLSDDIPPPMGDERREAAAPEPDLLALALPPSELPQMPALANAPSPAQAAARTRRGPPTLAPDHDARNLRVVLQLALAELKALRALLP